MFVDHPNPFAAKLGQFADTVSVLFRFLIVTTVSLLLDYCLFISVTSLRRHLCFLNRTIYLQFYSNAMFSIVFKLLLFSINIFLFQKLMLFELQIVSSCGVKFFMFTNFGMNFSAVVKKIDNDNKRD